MAVRAEESQGWNIMNARVMPRPFSKSQPEAMRWLTSERTDSGLRGMSNAERRRALCQTLQGERPYVGRLTLRREGSARQAVEDRLMLERGA